LLVSGGKRFWLKMEDEHRAREAIVKAS